MDNLLNEILLFLDVIVSGREFDEYIWIEANELIIKIKNEKHNNNIST